MVETANIRSCASPALLRLLLVLSTVENGLMNAQMTNTASTAQHDVKESETFEISSSVQYPLNVSHIIEDPPLVPYPSDESDTTQSVPWTQNPFNESNTTPTVWGNATMDRATVDAPITIKLAGLGIVFCDSRRHCSQRCNPAGPDDKSREPVRYGTTESVVPIGKKLESRSMSSLVNNFVTTVQNDYDTEEKARRHHRMKRSEDQNGRRECVLDPSLRELCYCDEECVMYGDCCVDFFENCMNITDPREILEFITETVKKFHEDFQLEVMSFSQFLEFTDKFEIVLDSFISTYSSCHEVDPYLKTNALLISRCPETVEDISLKDKCEFNQSQLLPPVTETLSGSSVTFRNAFCAYCHGITDTQTLMVWTSQMYCNFDENDTGQKIQNMHDIAEYVKGSVCNVTFTAPSHLSCFPGRCEINSSVSEMEKLLLKEREGNCSSLDELLCKSYVHPVYEYRNPHCVKCLESLQGRGLQFWKDGCYMKSFSGGAGQPNIVNSPAGGILIILDLTGKYSQTTGNGWVEEYLCENNEVFDPFTYECKPLLCQHGFEPFRGTCVESETAYIVDSSTQIFPLPWNQLVIYVNRKYSSMSMEECQNLLHHETFSSLLTHRMNVNKIVSGDFVHEFDQPNLMSNDSIMTVCGDMLEASHDSLQHFSLHVDVMGTADLEIIDQLKTVAHRLVSKAYQEGSFEVLITNMINVTDNCPSGFLDKRTTEFTFDEHKGVLYVINVSSVEGVLYPLTSVGYEVVQRLSDLFPSETVVLCQRSQLFSRASCRIVDYLLNQTFLNNSQLLILGTDQIYEKQDFEVYDDRVLVCTAFRNPDLSFRNNKGYIIISWVFSVISIVFLFIMLVIYHLFPDLCTLPGKLTASLAATMMLTFVANLFTLVDLHNDYICPVAAAVTHLVTLAHFGWMAAIAVNMALTFGFHTMNTVKSLNGNKAFLRYNLAVWGVSGIIVAISLALDLTHPEESHFPLNNSTLASVDITTNSSNTMLEVSKTDSDSTVPSGFPRYGYPYCTWFSGDMWTKLAFVNIPFFITYIITVIGFVVTLMGINKASKSAQKIGKKSSERTRCLIYFKLSTAMGFSWIISLVLIAFPDATVLAYIYMVLVLLQGVLLFLAFMVNRRVYSLLTRRFAASKDTTTKVTTQSKATPNITAMASTL